EGQRKQVEIVLPEARESMVVRVTDERGAAIDGAQLRVSSLAHDSPLRRTVFCDRDGKAEIRDVFGLPVRIEASASGRAPLTKELERARGEVAVWLERRVRAVGRVRARGGREFVAGAEVPAYATGAIRRTRTDKQGAYRLDGVAPGSARLVVDHTDYVVAERT